MQQSNLDTVFSYMRTRGWEPCPGTDYGAIATVSFRDKTLPVAFVAHDLLAANQPMTLRGLFYRVVSAGWLPSTDRKHYATLGRIMTQLREQGIVPFNWIVDSCRSTIKPSSWSGLAEFSDTVRDAYRRDFWAELPEYVHVFCEKDAMAGALAPITEEYDVPLSVIRGYVSLSFAHEIADLWNQIEKPIFAYYLGDFDPSGLDLESNLRRKLERYCQRPFSWQRLAVRPADFAAFDLFPLKPKSGDRRTKAFLAEGYTQCAELDALPAPELRERLTAAVQAHIPAAEWERLQHVEQVERDSVRTILDAMPAGAA